MWMVSSCRQVIRWWSESLDRRISWWRKLLISFHTRRCPPCARYQEQVQSTSQMHRQAAEDMTTRLSESKKAEIVHAMETGEI
jgi:hypothetical protein